MFKRDYPALIEKAKRRMIAGFAVKKADSAMEDLENTLERMKREKSRQEVKEYYKKTFFRNSWEYTPVYKGSY